MTRFNIMLIAAALAVCLSTGCAPRGSREFSSNLPDVANIAEAEQAFGQPTDMRDLGGGKTLSIWEFKRYEQVPGQYVDERRYIGHDRDGFPKYRLMRYWVPFHVVDQFCRLEIVAGPSGNVESSTWDGNACDYLLSERGREKAYAPQPPPPAGSTGRVRRKRVPVSPFFGDDLI